LQIGTNIITNFAGTGSPNYNSENVLELIANVCRYENAFRCDDIVVGNIYFSGYHNKKKYSKIF
jgi:hypothetical protein